MKTTTLTTPDGPFSVVVAAVPAVDGGHPAGETREQVLAAGWTDNVDALLALVHPTLRPSGDVRDTHPTGLLAEAADAVRAYYDGDHGAPGRVPVLQASGPYRTHAWDVLREVKAGERLTYSEYAARTGRPAAVRAAAGACAMNAAALFVPCHRILRTDGTLGGFRYGLPVKESLLAREAIAG
ncbi:methylated-DNA--[protein]-cysteine S-methyltransferase [Promicromonospora sp. NPDC050262]|uniref:methylated-DNA--[protein]-cysteine S-methyltransferase n=1 Tax=Promicromonospora sp. NPDC050262 TaxID=3155036 RepID=UPI0033C2226E